MPASPLLLDVQHADGHVLRCKPRAPAREGRGWRAWAWYGLGAGWVEHPLERAFTAHAGSPDGERIQALLAAGANPNRRLVRGRAPFPTALGAAVAEGRPDLVRALLAAGADPELPTGPRRETPLGLALRSTPGGSPQLGEAPPPWVQCCEALLDAGASLEGFGQGPNGAWVTAAWWAEANRIASQPWFRSRALAERLDAVLPEAQPRARPRL